VRGVATCPKCGVPIAYDGAKCGACAARAAMAGATRSGVADARPCPSCGSPLRAGARSCLVCRTSLEPDTVAGPLVCPKCGASLAGEWATCNACAIRDRFTERDRQRALLETARQEAALRRAEADVAEAQRIHDHDTGLGRCPTCGSTNVAHVRKDEVDSGAQAAFAGCMCCCIAWPLALLAPFLFKGKATYGHCNSCGHEWPL
jgi:predicted RNA-binding Zn-ribbon protein involved in translation (DUF1610 family)